MTVLRFPAANRQRPRPKPLRFVRWLERPSPEFDGWGALVLQVAGKSAIYLLHQLPTEPDRLAFELCKLDAALAVTATYHVELAGLRQAGCSCHGSECCHGDAIRALLAAGPLAQLAVKVPDPQPPHISAVSRRAKDYHCPYCQAATDGGPCDTCWQDMQDELRPMEDFQ